MTRHARAAKLLLLALAFAANAQAQDFSLLGRQLRLPPPQGYCVADDSHVERPVVARMRKLLEPQGPFLMMFVECAELQRIREAGREFTDGFTDFGTYSAFALHGELKAVDQSRQAFLGAIASVDDEAAAREGIDRGLKRLRAIGRTITSTVNLGILGVDSNAIYMGVATAGPGQDAERAQGSLNVGAMTLVKGMRLSISRVRVYRKPEDLPTLLADQKRAMSELVAANE